MYSVCSRKLIWATALVLITECKFHLITIIITSITEGVDGHCVSQLNLGCRKEL